MTGRPSNVLRTENVGRCSLCEDASGSLHRVALRFACLWRRSNGPHGLRTIWAGSHVIGVRGLSDPGQLEEPGRPSTHMLDCGLGKTGTLVAVQGWCSGNIAARSILSTPKLARFRALSCGQSLP